MALNGEGGVRTLADLVRLSTNRSGRSGGTTGIRESGNDEERTRQPEEREREQAERWRTEQLVAARISELQVSGLLSLDALDVARAAAAESRAAQTVQIWQGLLRINPPSAPGGGVGEALDSMTEGAGESYPTFSSELQARAGALIRTPSPPERPDRQNSKLRAKLPETVPNNLQQLVIIPLKDTLLHHRKARGRRASRAAVTPPHAPPPPLRLAHTQPQPPPARRQRTALAPLATESPLTRNSLAPLPRHSRVPLLHATLAARRSRVPPARAPWPQVPFKLLRCYITSVVLRCITSGAVQAARGGVAGGGELGGQRVALAPRARAVRHLPRRRPLHSFLRHHLHRPLLLQHLGLPLPLASHPRGLHGTHPHARESPTPPCTKKPTPKRTPSNPSLSSTTLTHSSLPHVLPMPICRCAARRSWCRRFR